MLNSAERLLVQEQGPLPTPAKRYSDEDEFEYSLDPQANAYQLADFLWRKLKEPSEAEAVLRTALNQFPYSGEQQRWLHLLGKVYRSQERWTDAVPLYELLLEIDSRDVSAALALGDNSAKRGDGATQVMAKYQLAMAADPDRGEAYFAIGQILARSGEFQRAEHWLEQAVSRKPDALGWQLAFAANARDLSDAELMTKRYKQLQIAFPENHRAQMEAAWAYFQVGLIDDAKATADIALRLAGATPPQLYLDRAEKIYAE